MRPYELVSNTNINLQNSLRIILAIEFSNESRIPLGLKVPLTSTFATTFTEPKQFHRTPLCWHTKKLEPYVYTWMSIKVYYPFTMRRNNSGQNDKPWGKYDKTQILGVMHQNDNNK